MVCVTPHIHISHIPPVSPAYSFRDQLRNAGVQSEMIDQLGGWSNQSVGQGYGKGYSINRLSISMSMLSLCDVQSS